MSEILWRNVKNQSRDSAHPTDRSFNWATPWRMARSRPPPWLDFRQARARLPALGPMISRIVPSGHRKCCQATPPARCTSPMKLIPASIIARRASSKFTTSNPTTGPVSKKASKCVARAVELKDCSVRQFEPDKIAGLTGDRDADRVSEQGDHLQKAMRADADKSDLPRRHVALAHPRFPPIWSPKRHPWKSQVGRTASQRPSVGQIGRNAA